MLDRDQTPSPSVAHACRCVSTAMLPFRRCNTVPDFIIEVRNLLLLDGAIYYGEEGSQATGTEQSCVDLLWGGPAWRSKNWIFFSGPESCEYRADLLQRENFCYCNVILSPRKADCHLCVFLSYPILLKRKVEVSRNISLYFPSIVFSTALRMGTYWFTWQEDHRSPLMGSFGGWSGNIWRLCFGRICRSGEVPKTFFLLGF